MHSTELVRPVALENVPGGHCLGRSVPSGQYEPSGHGMNLAESARVGQ